MEVRLLFHHKVNWLLCNLLHRLPVSCPPDWLVTRNEDVFLKNVGSPQIVLSVSLNLQISLPSQLCSGFYIDGRKLFQPLWILEPLCGRIWIQMKLKFWCSLEMKQTASDYDWLLRDRTSPIQIVILVTPICVELTSALKLVNWSKIIYGLKLVFETASID